VPSEAEHALSQFLALLEGDEELLGEVTPDEDA
jgi:hypothetical protein